MTTNDMASSFRKGAEELVGAALVVGMGKGIVLVLGGTSAGEPSVLNTILNWVATGMEGMHSAFSAWVMYIFQSCFNFFVVSGSGQAALTMPIMAPLSDLLGVTRQVAVLAFQLGDGFTNLIVPTSGLLMAIPSFIIYIRFHFCDWSFFGKFLIRKKLEKWAVFFFERAAFLYVTKK